MYHDTIQVNLIINGLIRIIPRLKDPQDKHPQAIFVSVRISETFS